MKNQNSNLIVCPHQGEKMHRIQTSTKTVFLCQACLADMEGILSSSENIRMMIKSTMTVQELQKLRHERENMRIQAALAESVAIAHAVAGFPILLALPAPAVGMGV